MQQEERENFYRNSTVIVDIGKETLSALLNNELSNEQLTLSDFINKYQHAIYHLCFNLKLCCLCVNGRLPSTVPSCRVLKPVQLDILFDKSVKLPSHNASFNSQYCCCVAKPAITVNDLDITLLRFLLIHLAASCTEGQPVRKAVEELARYRNFLYGHAEKARISNHDYKSTQPVLERYILQIADFCNIRREIHQKLKDAYNRRLDETVLIEFQNLLLKDIRRNHDIQEDVKRIELQATDIHNQIQSQVSDSTRNLHEQLETVSNNIENKFEDVQNVLRDQHKDLKSCTLNILQQVEENKSEVTRSIQTVQEQMKHSEEEISLHLRDAKSRMQIQSKEINDHFKDTNKRSTDNIEYMKEFVQNSITEHGSLQDVWLQNLITQTQDRITNHKKDTTIYETRSMSKASKVLTKHNTLVILGKEGSGKSTVSMQIAKKFEKLDYVPILFVDKEIMQHRQVLCTRHKYLIIVEDFFGIKYEEDKHNRCLDLLNTLVGNNPTLKIVLTILNKQIGQYDIMKTHALFEKAIFINLDAHGLSDKEKINILLNHMRRNSISKCNSPCNDNILFDYDEIPKCNECQEEVQKLPNGQLQLCTDAIYLICFIDTYLGFPRMCRLFCFDHNNTLLGLNFFRRTTKGLLNQLNDLLAASFENVRSRYQYCLLLYMAMSNGHLYYDTVVSNFKKDSLFQELLCIFETGPHNMRKTLIRNALRELERDLIIKTSDFHEHHCDFTFQGVKNTYILKDNAIIDAVLHSYGTEYPEEFLNLSVCDIRFIMSYIRPMENSHMIMKEENMIFVPLELLNDKLYRILRFERGMDYTLKYGQICGFERSARREKNAEEKMTSNDEYGLGKDTQSSILKENRIQHKEIRITCKNNNSRGIQNTLKENTAFHMPDEINKSRDDKETNLSVIDEQNALADETEQNRPINDEWKAVDVKAEINVSTNDERCASLGVTNGDLSINDDQSPLTDQPKTHYLSTNTERHASKNQRERNPSVSEGPNASINNTKTKMSMIDEKEIILSTNDNSVELFRAQETNLSIDEDINCLRVISDSILSIIDESNEVMNNIEANDEHAELGDRSETQLPAEDENDDKLQDDYFDEDINVDDTDRDSGNDAKEYPDKSTKDDGFFSRYILCSASEKVGAFLRQCIVDGYTNDLVEEFFEHLKILSLSPKQITRVLDGLTRRGTCTQILSVNTDKIRNIILKYGGVKLICKLCRPKSKYQSSDSFYRVERAKMHDLLIHLVYTDVGYPTVKVVGNYLNTLGRYKGYRVFAENILKSIFEDYASRKISCKFNVRYLLDGLLENERIPWLNMNLQRFVTVYCEEICSMNLIFNLCQVRGDNIVFDLNEHIYFRKTKLEFIEFVVKRMFLQIFVRAELKGKVDFSIQTKDLGNDLYYFGLKIDYLNFMDDLLLSVVNMCSDMTNTLDDVDVMNTHFLALLIKGFTNDDSRVTELKTKYPKSFKQMRKHIIRYNIYMETGEDCVKIKNKALQTRRQLQIVSKVLNFNPYGVYLEG